MTINVILEKTDTNWCAFTPDDIGSVFTTGTSRDEAIDNFRSALRSHLAAMKDEGFDTPLVDGLNVQDLVTA